MVAHNLVRYAINVSNYIVVDGGCSTINSRCNPSEFSQLFLIKV